MMNELSILDTLFDDVMGTISAPSYRACYSPRVDVKSNDQGYVLEMDLPGYSEDDVNIELDHNTLTIASKETSAREEKKEAKEEAKTNWILHERHSAQFKRSFTLPEDVNGETITATFKNGVLTLNMPRQEVAAPKKILINAA